MKRVSAVVLFAFVCSFAFAQTDENKKSLLHLSFISPFGTNGIHSAQYTNGFSLNLLVGVSRNEEYLTIGGLSNIIHNDAKGVQIAGLSNHVGNNGMGVQCAGLLNTNKGSFDGVQIGGLLNTASHVKGIQIGGLVNTAQDVKGFQIGGLVNVAKHVEGVQIGGFVNAAGNVNGVQIGGLVNVAKVVKGVQIGGLVNIAESSDVPIGLVNIIRKGEMGIAVTYDGLGNVVASFRSGGKYTYGILGVGYNHKMKSNGLVSEAGLGVHIPVATWFRINQELKATNIWNGLSQGYFFNTGYSLLPAFRIGRHVELFGGVSVNYMEANNKSAEHLFPAYSLWKGNQAAKLQQLYIGYQAGVQFIF